MVQLSGAGLRLEASPKKGVISWAFAETQLASLLNGMLALPVIGGPSLSGVVSRLFLVFTYVWLPFMILPQREAEVANQDADDDQRVHFMLERDAARRMKQSGCGKDMSICVLEDYTVVHVVVAH